MTNNSRSILVTGAAGFVSSQLVCRLVGEGHRVHVLVRPSSDLWRIADVLPNITCHRGDLGDANSLHAIIRDCTPSGIFHLATSTIMSGKTASAEDVVRTNVLGTVNLLTVLQDIPYDFFIQTGSDLEYGPQDHPPQEADRCEPWELYSVTKLAATLYGQAQARAKKKPILTFRLCTPYGPFIQDGRLVQIIIANALRGDPIKLTQKEVVRDYIFIEDLMDLLVEAMDKASLCGGQIFNAGSGEATTLESLVDRVLNITGSRSTVEWNAFPSVLYDQDRWQADMTKTFSRFSWRPKYSLEEGLTKTVDWIRKSLETKPSLG